MAPTSATAPTSARQVESETPRIDIVLEGLILMLLLYLPLAFGGVMPTSRIVMVAFGSLIAACFAVRCVAEPKAAIVWSWAFVPAIGLLLLALFQQVPLPMGVLEVLSPKAADIWKQAAEASGEPMTWATLSVYPHGSAKDIVLLACAVIVLVVGASVYRRRDAFQRLLTGIALIGLVVALIGLAQIGLGAERIYWHYEGPGGRTNSGPFASYSHYSEFINISLGCALGVLLIRAGSRGPTRQFELRSIVDWNAHNMGRVEKALCAFLVIGVAAVVLSTSRNGLISLVVAMGVTAALMHVTRKVEGIGWPMVGFAFACTLGLLALGVDPILDRFEQATESGDGAVTTRLDLIRDTTSMTLAFPIFGAGIGTYALAFPGFDESMRGGTAEHAENQYMEVFAEFGILGGLAALTFVVLCLTLIWRQLRHTASRTDIGLFGVLFSLAAIGFHSVSDFGLEIPAVGMLVATILSAALGRGGESLREHMRARIAGGVCAAAGAVLLVSTLSSSFAAADAHHDATVANAIRAGRTRFGSVSTEEGHQRLVELTRAAAEADPSNAEHRFWAVFAEWNQAVAEACEFEETDEPIDPFSHPELADPARKAVNAFTASLRMGPTHGPTWSAAGQLRRIWLEDPENPESEVAGDWILRGRELAPHHPSTCMAAAFELMRRDKETEALAELERAVTVGGSKYAVVDLLARDLQRPTLALLFAEGDVGLTERLLAHVRGLPAQGQLEARLAEDFEELLRIACASPNATARDLGRLARIERDRGAIDEALRLFRRLLGVDPYSRYRYEYARLLHQEGDPRAAIRECNDLLKFHPGHAGATQLLASIENAN